MESSNNLSSGMNNDISKVYHSKDSYVQAINFRANTELGESNGSLVNIKGNECSISFPTLQNIYKLKLINDGTGNPTDYSQITITVNGQTTNTIILNNATTGFTLYTELLKLNNAYNSTNNSPLTSTFTVNYSDDYIIISQTPVYEDCGPSVNSINSIIVINNIVNNRYKLYYTLPDGSTQSGNTPFINMLTSPNNAGPIIIGSTFMMDEIYLYTAIDSNTYSSTVPTHDSATSTGQIWKLNINDITRQNTLTLLYNNYLNFTKYHPIAPSATLARYESQGIKRLYWTDFYNKIKTLNVGDSQLMALNVALVSVIPSIDFDIPILSNIVNGSLESGSYELSYRLTQNLGAVTNYSSLSDIVNIIDKDPNSNNFIAYEGPVGIGNSGRAIEWTITNIDTKFDNIEFAVLYRNTLTNIATVYKINSEPIPSNGIKILTVSNLTNNDTIDLDQFLTLATSFTHAKTVDTKDNRLFWGNVKAQTADLGNWDARAFRALTSNISSTDIKLTNIGVNGSYTLSQAINTPETNDSINEYYTASGDFNLNACYFKPDTVGGILGGKGLNISYEFGTESILLNNMNLTSNTGPDYNLYNSLPFRIADNISETINLLDTPNNSPNQLYPTRGVGSMKNPYKTAVLRGYQHEEIYRFGIQFFDNEGNPYFTKWIGDVKMPSYGDFNNNPDSQASGAGINDFRLSYVNPYAIWGQILYIKFNVDVSGISDNISGYRIVRVERSNEDDKTILGCGIITPTFVDGGSTNAFLPACFRNVNTTFPSPIGGIPNLKPWNPFPGQPEWESLSLDGGVGEEDNMAKVKTFDCFDFTIKGGITYNSSDKIFIRGKLRSYNYMESMSGNNQGYRWWDFAGGGGGGWFDLSTTKDKKPIAGPLAPGIGAFDGYVAHYQSGFDSDEMAYYLHMYLDESPFGNFSAISNATYSRSITDGQWIPGGNTGASLSNGLTYYNKGVTFGVGSSDTINPCFGSRTYVMGFDDTSKFRDYDAPFNRNASTNAGKLLALYYKPNIAQYGGATYSARSENEYIPCGSYIPIKRNDIILANNLSLSFDTYGGDVFTNYWDHQKAQKDSDDGTGSGPSFSKYNHNGTEVGGLGAIEQAEATVSVTYFFPCTNYHNQELRYGNHINSSLNSNTYSQEDEDLYQTYHSNERNIVKYFPKPLNFILKDEWINRVFFSQIKFNNESQDSWSIYKTNDFYDVEGNYGAINSLITLQNQMYYLQDRGLGVLLINPIAMIDAGIGADIKLGTGSVIEKHNYIAQDVGTKHQWSVYKSQNQIVFVDVRHKKLYTFNGRELTPISDTLGQRNFLVKRLHNVILSNDNPIINKGIISTYDYYHNEFLFTFLNDGQSNTNDEYYTIALSEKTGKFTSLYSFTPNIYINNNRYLLSTNTLTKNNLYLHNYGEYGKFYGILYPSNLKVLVNDNPNYTKIFDNLTWQSESIKDNIEWSDDLNEYPGAITNPSYPDNINYQNDTFSRIRCYNDWQNSDWVNLTTIRPNNNLTRKERDWNLQMPRNRFNYDTTLPSTSSLFDSSKLTKLTFGERIRDKYVTIDLEYSNSINNRFIIHNLNTIYRLSDR